MAPYVISQSPKWDKSRIHGYEFVHWLLRVLTASRCGRLVGWLCVSLYEVIIVMTCMGLSLWLSAMCVCNCDDFVALVTADLWSCVAMAYRRLCDWNIAVYVTGISLYVWLEYRHVCDWNMCAMALLIGLALARAQVLFGIPGQTQNTVSGGS